MIKTTSFILTTELNKRSFFMQMPYSGIIYPYFSSFEKKGFGLGYLYVICILCCLEISEMA